MGSGRENAPTYSLQICFGLWTRCLRRSLGRALISHSLQVLALAPHSSLSLSPFHTLAHHLSSSLSRPLFFRSLLAQRPPAGSRSPLHIGRARLPHTKECKNNKDKARPENITKRKRRPSTCSPSPSLWRPWRALWMPAGARVPRRRFGGFGQ